MVRNGQGKLVCKIPQFSDRKFSCHKLMDTYYCSMWGNCIDADVENTVAREGSGVIRDLNI